MQQPKSNLYEFLIALLLQLLIKKLISFFKLNLLFWEGSEPIIESAIFERIAPGSVLLFTTW